ncbi:hydroxymethylglutaryl-CoA reductase [Planctobacterium marinum]|uniref:hydroxymethylglutaryl-CoA reductase (NADPH) n=1 Tax=Planctobacterium marinum TaxID=1631968 RepID=A0AA48HUH5_9ALTE|nr:hydroxymethylglutaryl-CoA reductase [Planctobacterium marinum]
MFIPSILLKQLYTRGSLTSSKEGISFKLKNRLKDATVKSIQEVKLNGRSVPIQDISLEMADGQLVSAQNLNGDKPLEFPLRSIIEMRLARVKGLSEEVKHSIVIGFEVAPFGKLKLEVEDVLSKGTDADTGIPRVEQDDYSRDAAEIRQEYLETFSGKTFEHIKQYSFEPQELQGNIENFTGVAQVPLGLAGPITINGEHAQGDFIVPMATTEGTLVASYNRGIKLMNACGGVKCTVLDDAMQRAPVFVFQDARGARDFVDWIEENFTTIKQQAEATSHIAKLTYIDHFLSNKFAFLRFNFKTGDAAGQNMVGRATFAACGWILDSYKQHKITDFYLESNFATDKKASQINIMRTRGKRVVAEVRLKKEQLLQIMRVDPLQLDYHHRVSSIGSFLSGVNNTGLHSPNGITAMFIATGQDVANVAESSAAIFYSEIDDDGDLYLSITIPSLIVATYGGGTGFGTQKECLQMMDCYGENRVYKFAEIVAGVVMAGEISLAAAISSSDWVSSHEKHGRNR